MFSPPNKSPRQCPSERVANSVINSPSSSEWGLCLTCLPIHPCLGFTSFSHSPINPFSPYPSLSLWSLVEPRRPLMTCSTGHPSAGNYNICRHHKRGPQRWLGQLSLLELPLFTGRIPLDYVWRWKEGETQTHGYFVWRKGQPHNTDRHADSKHKHG